MRILAISDVHGSSAALNRIGAKAKKAELLLIAGDLTDFGGAREAKNLLSFLEAFKGKIILVPGNCDKRGAREFFSDEGICADGRFVEAGGARVIGAGGCPLRTGLTPYERQDYELSDALELALEELSEAGSDPSQPLIVLTHAPPKASGADRRKGADVGSPALKEALLRIAPPLWVCGHIHESPCAAYLGRTLMLNPGSLHDGRYAEALLERGSDGAWRASAELLRLD
jgi:uncharacterized protein